MTINNPTTIPQNKLVADVDYSDGCFTITFYFNQYLSSYFSSRATEAEEAVSDVWSYFAEDHSEFKNRKPVIHTHWDENS